VQKIYFQPDMNLSLAISQIVSTTNSIRALRPTGTQLPIVVQYSASAGPVLQISLCSDRLGEAQLYDYAGAPGLHQRDRHPLSSGRPVSKRSPLAWRRLLIDRASRSAARTKKFARCGSVAGSARSRFGM
jgi:hypothetical protein